MIVKGRQQLGRLFSSHVYGRVKRERPQTRPFSHRTRVVRVVAVSSAIGLDDDFYATIVGAAFSRVVGSDGACFADAYR